MFPLNDMCAQQWLRSACAFVQHVQYSKDCPNAQVDLSILWAHVFEGTFSIVIYPQTPFSRMQAHAHTVKFHPKTLFFSCAEIQSTFIISKSKWLSEILRDIRTSTYQNCRIEEKINQTTTFHKWICNLTPEVRDILKILWKRGEIAP